DCSNGCLSNPHRGGRSSGGTSDLSCRTTPVGAPGNYVHQCVFARDPPPDRGGLHSRHAPTSATRRYLCRNATARAAARASVADVVSRWSHTMKKGRGAALGGWSGLNGGWRGRRFSTCAERRLRREARSLHFASV